MGKMVATKTAELSSVGTVFPAISTTLEEFLVAIGSYDPSKNYFIIILTINKNDLAI